MKMQSTVNKFQSKTRKFVQPYIHANDNLYKLAVSIHRSYCFLTGFMHILPDFYIIGVQKSGTSALYDYLIEHPSIYPSRTKEVRYFDKYYKNGINWYKVNFPLTIQKTSVKKILGKPFVTGEATERYIDHPRVPERIKNITPNAKFIVLLRNPIERAYSHWNMLKTSVKDKEKCSFEEAIKLEEERNAGKFEKLLNDPDYYDDNFFRFSYLKRGIYVEKLKHWMNVFPRKQFLIIKSEDFFQNPSKNYTEILSFLDLPSIDLQDYQKIGAGKYKNSKIDPSFRKQLVEYFKPYNEQLYQFLGVNYQWD